MSVPALVWGVRKAVLWVPVIDCGYSQAENSKEKPLLPSWHGSLDLDLVKFSSMWYNTLQNHREGLASSCWWLRFRSMEAERAGSSQLLTSWLSGSRETEPQLKSSSFFFFNPIYAPTWNGATTPCEHPLLCQFSLDPPHRHAQTRALLIARALLRPFKLRIKISHLRFSSLPPIFQITNKS